MKRGWIRLYRKLEDSSTYRKLNSKQRDVFIQCLLLANYKENYWVWNNKDFECKPGQFVTSLDEIMKRCGKDVKIQSVRTALLKLEKLGFLTCESTNDGRLITICNWGLYQPEEKQTNKENNIQPTSDQHLTRKKEIDNISLESFSAFWNSYYAITGKPKTDEEGAVKNWQKLNKSEQEKALSNIQMYYSTLNDKAYCKKAYTYLRDKTFNDEFNNHVPGQRKTTIAVQNEVNLDYLKRK